MATAVLCESRAVAQPLVTGNLTLYYDFDEIVTGAGSWSFEIEGELDPVSRHYFRELMERAGFRTVTLRHMNPAGAWGYSFKRGNRSSYSQTISPVP